MHRLKPYFSPYLIVTIAVAMGCVLDGLIKHVGTFAQLQHILALRYLFGAILAAAIYCTPRQLSDGTREPRGIPSWDVIRFQSIRSIFVLIAGYLFFYGILRLDLAVATVLGLSTPLMIPALAWPFLGERPNADIFMLTLVGMVGAAVVIMGHHSAIDISGPIREVLLPSIACLVASALYGIVLVMLRMRAGTDGPVTIALFSNLVPALVLLPVFIATDGFAANATLVLYCAIMSVFGYSVWYLMSLAYAQAPAQRLAAFDYTSLVWAALIGYVVFQEIPTWHLWAGSALIIGACLVIAAQSRQPAVRITPPPRRLR